MPVVIILFLCPLRFFFSFACIAIGKNLDEKKAAVAKVVRSIIHNKIHKGLFTYFNIYDTRKEILESTRRYPILRATEFLPRSGPWPFF